MGKWLDALKQKRADGFGGFGGATTEHFPEKKPDSAGFGGFGCSTMGHFPKIAGDEFRRQGLKVLEAAAAGLPIPLDDLAVIFADDLEDFGAGAVSMAGIRQACEFYAMGRPQPQRGEIPAGMVRCTDCQQDRCKHKRVTPWGSVERQSSPQWRWCSDYNPLDSNVTAFRGKPCASK